ncbi:hypothetical protein K469DRAFT_694142 [Zopfia rhizophila CBS 207.26]|uniref:Uncharacterized protein n=1 Tax=Zopfia rhizophila CBS 207.26 TaxID=1314779 RepID=A0A6A6DK04_9PEZI|nr:hypothetical protein K469DRAFT_694142 [Zopfia rhizophila CBS 207.26]
MSRILPQPSDGAGYVTSASTTSTSHARELSEGSSNWSVESGFSNLSIDDKVAATGDTRNQTAFPGPQNTSRPASQNPQWNARPGYPYQHPQSIPSYGMPNGGIQASTSRYNPSQSGYQSQTPSVFGQSWGNTTRTWSVATQTRRELSTSQPNDEEKLQEVSRSVDTTPGATITQPDLLRLNSKIAAHRRFRGTPGSVEKLDPSRSTIPIDVKMILTEKKTSMSGILDTCISKKDSFQKFFGRN